MALPRFKRKWRVLVSNKNNIALDVSDLRCVFNIHKSLQVPNYADIIIYNLSPNAEQQIIQSGTRVVVEAGYENGDYGKIFDGDVIQPLWDRENVVDYSLTLRCIDGDIINNDNFIAFTFEAQQDQRAMVLQMAKNCRTPFEVTYITDSLSKNKSMRGQTFFGEPVDYLQTIAVANDSQYLVVDGKANIGRITDQSPLPGFTLGPDSGLIGTPQQTLEGVNFRCLLNPNIKFGVPQMVIKLDMSVIRQQKIKQGQLVGRLDRDGIYKVISVDYLGDTRGNDWYCDVVGVNSDMQGKMPMIYETINQQRQ